MTDSLQTDPLDSLDPAAIQKSIDEYTARLIRLRRLLRLAQEARGQGLKVVADKPDTD